MRTDDFNFELPSELIAQYPLEERDKSRLLHYNPESKSIEHLNFKDIVAILNPGDLLIRNTTKVLPARLFVKNPETSTEIEILLIKPFVNQNSNDNGYRWEILGKPWKKLKDGLKYKLPNGQEILIEEIFVEKNSKTIKVVNFGDYESFKKATSEVGSMPIPPYMKRIAEESDKERYQTIYAKEKTDGSSVAAPTAGLHFTEDIFKALEDKGIEVIDLTLHVGTGTFLPIKADEIKDHKMQSENFSITKKNWERVLKAKKEGRQVLTVGTTSTRCIESLARSKELFTLKPIESELDFNLKLNHNEELIYGSTDIFIYPGYEFKIVDALLTNFHLPKSSLIILISAMMGRTEVMNTYKEAIDNGYRFYSYGDCMLIY